MVSPWLRPEPRGRLRQASEDDQLLVDDKSDETGWTVAISLRTGDHLNVPGLEGLEEQCKHFDYKILFPQARETLKAGVWILIFIHLFSIAPSECRIEHFGAVIAEIIFGENDHEPGENVPETLTEPEM